MFLFVFFIIIIGKDYGDIDCFIIFVVSILLIVWEIIFCLFKGVWYGCFLIGWWLLVFIDILMVLVCFKFVFDFVNKLIFFLSKFLIKSWNLLGVLKLRVFVCKVFIFGIGYGFDVCGFLICWFVIGLFWVIMVFCFKIIYLFVVLMIIIIEWFFLFFGVIVL